MSKGEVTVSLMFDTARFTAQEASAWAKDAGYPSRAAKLQGAVWVIDLAPASSVRPSTFRSVSLDDGVHAVVGQPLSGSKSKSSSRGDQTFGQAFSEARTSVVQGAREAKTTWTTMKTSAVNRVTKGTGPDPFGDFLKRLFSAK